MDRLAAVINFRAGTGAAAKHWPRINKLLSDRLGPFQAYVCQDYGGGFQAAAQAVQDGAERLLCVGGDGTFNQVVNALMHKAKCPAEIPIGVIPNGTGCDLIRTLPIPRDLIRAIEVAAAGCRKAIDLGCVRCEGEHGKERSRYFHNVLSFGLGGPVVERVNRGSKLWGPHMAFVLAALQVIFRYTPRMVRLCLDQERVIQTKVWNVVIANGQFHGGGIWVAPQARMDDGIFNVTVIGDVSKLGMLVHVPKLYTGRIAYAPQVTLATARQVQASGLGVRGLDVDGEYWGGLPLRVMVVPQAISVYVQG